MMQFQFEEYVKKQQLFHPSERILLAVSGGLDSVVMTHLFLKAGFKIGIAHVNFKLRGEDSDGDALFVKDLARQYQVPFFETSFDTKHYAATHKVSTQMAARTLRYAWFEEIANTHQFDKIATAHHLDDSLETVLLNLSKGTGWAGLKGIRPRKNTIIRPLLFATRQEIAMYAAVFGLVWREDASNQETTYQRNFLRWEVIPLLQKINPDLLHTFRHTAERLSLASDFLEIQMKAFEAQILTRKEDYLQLDLLALEQTTAPLLLLEYILKKNGFQYLQTKQIWENRETLSGKFFVSASHKLYKDRNALIIIALDSEAEVVHEHVDKQQKNLVLAKRELHFTFAERTPNFEFPKNSEVLCIDADLITFPILIRTWQEGDYFYPLGMKGKKKISDFLIDLKIPLALKKNIWVACHQKEIMGVIGLRLDERYKITSNTKNIYLIEELKKSYD